MYTKAHQFIGYKILMHRDIDGTLYASPTIQWSIVVDKEKLHNSVMDKNLDACHIWI